MRTNIFEWLQIGGYLYGTSTEQERPDVAAARAAWREAQPGLNPAHLVFIDETGASTKTARRHGRCPFLSISVRDQRDGPPGFTREVQHLYGVGAMGAVYGQLSLEERVEIYRLHADGKSLRSIGLLLGPVGIDGPAGDTAQQLSHEGLAGRL